MGKAKVYNPEFTKESEAFGGQPLLFVRERAGPTEDHKIVLDTKIEIRPVMINWSQEPAVLTATFSTKKYNAKNTTRYDSVSVAVEDLEKIIAQAKKHWASVKVKTD